MSRTSVRAHVSATGQEPGNQIKEIEAAVLGVAPHQIVRISVRTSPFALLGMARGLPGKRTDG